MGDNILHLSDIGLQAALNAKGDALLIDVVSYKIGDSDIAHSDADEDIQGNVLLQGRIGFVEVMSKHSARFTIRINSSQITAPLIGKEISLFLPNNLMFGRCVFDEPFEMYVGENFELSLILSTSRCDLTVINVTLGEYSSIPSTANLVMLGHPDESEFNAVSVLDLVDNSDNTTSPGFAFKYGAGSLQWGFCGFDRVHSGLPNTGATNSQFTSSALVGSVSFQSGETVIVYVVAGPARGQTRKFYFNSAQQNFLLKGSDPFIGFDDTCTMVIWRRIAGAGSGVNNYPPQMTNIPHDWVITRGTGNIPVWAPPKNNSTNLNTLYVSPGRLRINVLNEVGDGQTSRYSTGNIIVKDVNHCITAIGGIYQHKSAYDINSAELEFSESIPANAPIDIRLVTKEPGTGSYADMFTDRFVGDGTRVAFQLSQPVENVNYLFVHTGPIWQAVTSYTYDPATRMLTFVSPVPAGIVIEVTMCVLRQDEGYSTTLLSKTIITVGPTLFIELPIQPQTIDHTFLSISGQHVSRDKYSLIDNKLVFSSEVEGNISIEVLIFHNILSLGSPQTNLSGVVTDAVMTHKSIKLFRHDAPPIELPIPYPEIRAGNSGIRVEGAYPNYSIVNLAAEQYTATTDFKISTRGKVADSPELIMTENIKLTDDIRLHITANFSAQLGPGFQTIKADEILEYVVGFKTTAIDVPDYGREIIGTGVAGFSSLKGTVASNETAYANATMTQIIDVRIANVPARYLDIVVKARIRSSNNGVYPTMLLCDLNILSLPIISD